MSDLIIFALIGVSSGLFSGLLGLGGGIVIVPALLIVFDWQGMSNLYLMHMAIATSLTTIIITSIISSYSHHKVQQVNWSLVFRLAPALIVGGILGGFLAIQISPQVLKNFFSAYLFFAALRMWLPLSFSIHQYFLNKFVLFSFGTSVGLVSSLLGIGGGTLIVPYLVMANLSIKQAIGTAATCGVVIAISAVTGFTIFGQQQVDETLVSEISLIYWPAFWGIISTSSIFAIIGVKLASRFSTVILKLLFSIVLLSNFIYLTFK